MNSTQSEERGFVRSSRLVIRELDRCSKLAARVYWAITWNARPDGRDSRSRIVSANQITRWVQEEFGVTVATSRVVSALAELQDRRLVTSEWTHRGRRRELRWVQVRAGTC